MKTFSVLLVLVLLCATFLGAQNVPNGGFEDWVDGEPVDWTTNNLTNFATITQTQDAHSGTYALKGQALEIDNKNFGPNLLSGLDNLGIPVSQNYHKLSFYYKFDNGGNDRLICAVIIADENFNTLGSGGWEQDENVDFFALATITILYSDPGGTAAHANIQFITLDDLGSGQPSTDSWFIIDDVELSGVVSDVNEDETINPVEFNLSQNYPNPFNPSTTIYYALPEASNVTLKIFNTLGEEVSVLVNSVMEAGTHEVNFEASQLNSGIYFYQLRTGNFVETKKMMLLK
jgi:hypothetical protein